jgi:prephenate dehydratase
MVIQERVHIIYQTQQSIKMFILGTRTNELESIDENVHLHNAMEQCSYTIDEAWVSPIRGGRQSPISPHG